ncbi:uncharacterized protein LOC143035884 [Oratosquilla oratoria]|uniref:uncharacterized protein LOC143035884 n=1 Tax=Oratosquilla oratoria TaxID=337810 RepID=UPI003F7728BD
MKPGKAPEPDNIPMELLTHGGPKLKNSFTSNSENMGDKNPPHIASKSSARILLDRLLILAKYVLPESHCEFRHSHGTIDTIFCVRLLRGKALEQQQPLMFIFWDLKKAIHKVPRTAIWAVLRRFSSLHKEYRNSPKDFLDILKETPAPKESKIASLDAKSLYMNIDVDRTIGFSSRESTTMTIPPP